MAKDTYSRAIRARNPVQLPTKVAKSNTQKSATKKPRKTTRRPKTDKVPRTRAGGQWTEASFWGFIRSGLRQMSRRWPPRKLAELAVRRPYTGDNARQKWEYQCAECQKWWKGAEIEVDHITPCGTLKSFDDIAGFAERLFCEIDGFRVVCIHCHKLKTQNKTTEGSE